MTYRCNHKSGCEFADLHFDNTYPEGRLCIGCDAQWEDVEHGVACAYYSNLPIALSPEFECLCGETFTATSWEDAGAMFDSHLEAP